MNNERFAKSNATASSATEMEINSKIEGSVRPVKHAKLVWKKREDNNTYTERWMFVAKNLDTLLSIKRAILQGTDIRTTKTSSADGTQSFALEQFGDVAWLTISGLKN